ncbi:MAG: hypothetical protein Tsb002_12040 [Wenzhouxiangellaceae bacterium]
MSSRIYELQGYAIALPHVMLVSAVFQADQQEGWQFNLRMNGGVRLPFKYPDRTEAAVARELLLKALKEYSAAD